MRKSLILVWHSGIFVFLQFGVKLGLKHSLWGNIAISQQSDYLCMSYERQVFILMCLIVNVRGSLHDTRNEICSKSFSFGHAKRFSFILLFIAEEMKHNFVSRELE